MLQQIFLHGKFFIVHNFDTGSTVFIPENKRVFRMELSFPEVNFSTKVNCKSIYSKDTNT